MVFLNGEIKACFSASNSCTDFGLAGAEGGAVLGKGAGNKVLPSC